MEIKKVINQDEKTRVTLETMNALPEWFSPPEDIVNKSQIHREYPFFAAYDGNEAIGFVALKIHNSYTADIYNLGVLKEWDTGFLSEGGILSFGGVYDIWG